MPVRPSIAAFVASVAAKYTASTRARVAAQHRPFLDSAIHIVRKVSSGNLATALAKLRASISGESVAATIFEHAEVVRSLNRSGARPLIERYPHYVNKYVHEYLVKSLLKQARRDILKFHHSYLARYVISSFYEQILQNHPVLWEEIIDGNRYAISLSFDFDGHAEGDVSLVFEGNGIPLYEVSFTIVPGNLIGCAAEQVLLVARLQGKRGQVEAIGIATRACHRITPPHLLMAALQSIATNFSIDTIAGVTNKEQLVRSEASNFFFDYDAFWNTFVSRRQGAVVYEISVPFPRKPVATPAYRSKVRLKRRNFKNQVGAKVRAAFAEKFVKARPSAAMPLI